MRLSLQFLFRRSRVVLGVLGVLGLSLNYAALVFQSGSLQLASNAIPLSLVE